MKEIGELLRETRTQNGVSIEEAAGDLNYKTSQLELVENGDYKAFKDIFVLKCIISDYAKYLGLDSEAIIDEFNEYVFESTSKIPIEEIEKAKLNNTSKKEVISPYTTEISDKRGLKIVLAIVGVTVLLIVGYFIVSNVKGNDFQDDNITYVIRR